MLEYIIGYEVNTFNESELKNFLEIILYLNGMSLLGENVLFY